LYALKTLKNHNIGISVCGDMAHNEKFIPFLLGIGLRNLSVDPLYIPRIKRSISGIDLKRDQKLAQILLKHNKISEVERTLNTFLDKKWNTVLPKP